MQVAIGPLLGGLLVASFGIRGALVVDALSFLLSAVVLLGVPALPPVRERADRSSFLTDTREGLAYVRRHAVARAVVVTLFLGVAFAGIDNVALVFLSREVLGAGALGFGVVAGAFGIGMLVASVVLSSGRAVRRARSSSEAGSSRPPEPCSRDSRPVLWLAVAAQAVGGIGNGADNVASDTLIQRSVPRDMLGRVFGVTSTAALWAGYRVRGRRTAARCDIAAFRLRRGGGRRARRRRTGGRDASVGALTHEGRARGPAFDGRTSDPGAILLGDDLEGQHRLDLREQMDPHVVRSEGADGLVQVHVLAVHLDARLRGDRLGDVGGRHRAEELALLTGTGRDRDLGRDERRRDRLELTFSLDWPETWARLRFSACFSAPFSARTARPRGTR